MANSRVAGVGLRGIASAVPKTIQTTRELADVFGEGTVQKIVKRIGVEERRVAGRLCSSDLCAAAADRLLDELQWERESVDALVFVTQTPDYVLPATACSLHQRLALPSTCLAFDVNLGCSGYVYGLWMASQFLQGGLKRLLLLVGDTLSRTVSPKDRATAMLFGDAGTATALERCPDASPLFFQLGTDGSGASHLITEAGSFRQPCSETTHLRTDPSGESVRSAKDLFMNGAEVFAFTLREVPDLVRDTLALANWSLEHLDAFVPHQANLFLLRHLAKRLNLSQEKVVTNLQKFGNTACASIPLAMTTEMSKVLAERPMNLLLAGFGAGWSWGAVTLSTQTIAMPALIEVES